MIVVHKISGFLKGLAYLFISVLVFILSRINNDDWESSHPCNQEPEEVESIWNILNCIWLMMGSIMGQGERLTYFSTLFGDN
jgi:uncharacterized membrane protein YccF (DUF307 family)